MSPNIQGNVMKNPGGCSQTFREMSPNIPANVVKNSAGWPQSDGFQIQR